MVNFDPSVGSEQQKVRPAVIVSKKAIGILPLCIVVPITSWDVRYGSLPWFIRLAPGRPSGLVHDSGADAFQVKSISLDRLERRIGLLNATQMDEIAAAIAMCVGFSP